LEIAKTMPKKGKLGIFVETLAAENAQQRLKGIKEALASLEVTYIEKQDYKDEAKAQSNVEDVLTSVPDINAVAGLWAYNGPAIAAAVKRANKVGKVACYAFDEFPDTLNAIEAGILTCTVVQKPFEFGYQSIKLLHALATKGESALPKGGVIDTGITVVSKSNVVAFKQDLANLKK
jgi:ribose transport system substrate-binding protein